MLAAATVQAVADADAGPSCLAELVGEARRRKEAAYAAGKRAGRLPVLTPGDALLPLGLPDDFAPQLVTASFTVAPTGRVDDCSETRGSRIAVLNGASCALLREHYGIRPGPRTPKRQVIVFVWAPRSVDPGQKRCEDFGRTIPVSIAHWVTPDVFAGTYAQSGAATVALDIRANGSVAGCAVREANIDRTLRGNLCAVTLKHAFVLPATDERGAFVPAQLLFRVRFRY